MIDPIKKLSKISNSFQSIIERAYRVFEILNIQPERVEVENPEELEKFKNSIRFEHVSFAYEKDKPVLQNIDLEIRKGEIIALVGASGIGKTTMVDLISRFYDVKEGRITIDGIDIHQYSLSSLRRQIGIVSQEIVLFQDSIKENILSK